METLPEEVNDAPTLSRHAKRKLENERTITGLQERIKELEKERKRIKRTNRELQELQIGSGDIRSTYRVEQVEILGSYITKGLSKVTKGLKALSRKESGGYDYGYGMPASEESLAVEAFIRRNSYWPNSIARPAKLVRKNPTQEDFDRMAVRASAAEKRLKSAH